MQESLECTMAALRTAAASYMHTQSFHNHLLQDHMLSPLAQLPHRNGPHVTDMASFGCIQDYHGTRWVPQDWLYLELYLARLTGSTMSSFATQSHIHPAKVCHLLHRSRLTCGHICVFTIGGNRAYRLTVDADIHQCIQD